MDAMDKDNFPTANLKVYQKQGGLADLSSVSTTKGFSAFFTRFNKKKLAEWKPRKREVSGNGLYSPYYDLAEEVYPLNLTWTNKGSERRAFCYNKNQSWNMT